MAGKQEQREARQKLRQADVSQIKRTVRDVVDLPGHRDRLHLERKHDKQSRERVGDEIGIGKGDAPGEPGVLRGEHSVLL